MAKVDKETEVKENKYKYFYEKHKHHHNHGGGHNDAIYGLSVIGALFYFLQHATNFQEVLIGIGKSVFWPAILMFKLLTFLHI